MSNESSLRVGILGAARIAKKNVAALRSVSSGCNFVAIASRSLEKAQAFVHDYVCNEGEENMIKKRERTVHFGIILDSFCTLFGKS